MNPIKLKPNVECPCGSGKKYKKCCRPYHHGMPIPTPVDTLRSRFSAYALRLVDHIMKTTHPESPHYQTSEAQWRLDLLANSLRNMYVSLQILKAEADTVTYGIGYFPLLRDGMEYTHSRDTFKQHNGSWLFFDDEPLTTEEFYEQKLANELLNRIETEE